MGSAAVDGKPSSVQAVAYSNLIDSTMDRISPNEGSTPALVSPAIFLLDVARGPVLLVAWLVTGAPAVLTSGRVPMKGAPAIGWPCANRGIAVSW